MNASLPVAHCAECSAFAMHDWLLTGSLRFHDSNCAWANRVRGEPCPTTGCECGKADCDLRFCAQCGALGPEDDELSDDVFLHADDCPWATSARQRRGITS